MRDESVCIGSGSLKGHRKKASSRTSLHPQNYAFFRSCFLQSATLNPLNLRNDVRTFSSPKIAVCMAHHLECFIRSNVPNIAQYAVPTGRSGVNAATGPPTTKISTWTIINVREGTPRYTCNKQRKKRLTFIARYLDLPADDSDRSHPGTIRNIHPLFRSACHCCFDMQLTEIEDRSRHAMYSI